MQQQSEKQQHKKEQCSSGIGILCQFFRVFSWMSIVELLEKEVPVSSTQEKK